MTPTDAGALVALIDRGDRAHLACAAALPNLPKPLVTTWPYLTEAMYLLGSVGGHTFQEKLWRLVEISPITLHTLSPAETARMRALMTTYHDVPMDMADVSLVAMAETMDARRIFTTDSDFIVYRLANSRALRMFP